MVDLTRRILVSHEGRRAVLLVWLALGCVTVITYTITHSLAYALVLGALIVFAAWWANFCLRRPG